MPTFYSPSLPCGTHIPLYKYTLYSGLPPSMPPLHLPLLIDQTMEQRPHPLVKQGSRKAISHSKSTSEPPRSCPRCESTNTKFCYYNNYSSSQPRYFCRACRRYWTQGGNLRNLPQGSAATRLAAKLSKRPSSTSTSVVPLHHQMSAVMEGPPWCFSGGGKVLRQSMGYGAVDQLMVAGLPEIAGEEGERMAGNLFGGFEIGCSGEGGDERMPLGSSGSFS